MLGGNSSVENDFSWFENAVTRIICPPGIYRIQRFKRLYLIEGNLSSPNARVQFVTHLSVMIEFSREMWYNETELNLFCRRIMYVLHLQQN